MPSVFNQDSKFREGRRAMLILGRIQFMLLLALIWCSCSTMASPFEIQAFQPAVAPIRAITTLTIKTNGDLNMTSNSSLQCRFKDISVPARVEDGFIFCETPPMRNIDRVSVHLDVDGKLFKTKKPLYFHEPFKVSNITPSVVSPAQNVHLTISGISCKDWMQYFVRFQTANGTKKTQQGICMDSVVSCYVPEFPPNTRLRVGLTLSNRLVEWASKKILIQYPIDAIKSAVKDVKTDTTRKGAFTFLVALRDRFKNSIRVIEKENKKPTKISVQYSPREKPKSMKFLECSMTLKMNTAGDAYLLTCAGAEKEQIFFYPSINNVPLGGQERYKVTTTLCPGRNSCKAEPKAFPFFLVLGCGGAALLVLLFAALLLLRYRRGRYQVAKKRPEAQVAITELEMEVQLSEDDITEDRTLVYQLENAALDASEKALTGGTVTQEGVRGNTSSINDSTKLHLGDSSHMDECASSQQGDEQKKEGSLEQHMHGKERKSSNQSNKEIEMSSMKQEEDGMSTFTAKLQTLVERFLNLTAAAEAETEHKEEENQRNEAQKQTLIVINEMDGTLREIEELCEQHGEEIKTQKVKEIAKALRQAYGESNSTGCSNMLPLIEELQESIASFGKVTEIENLASIEDSETAL